jgi:hypothetical protein
MSDTIKKFEELKEDAREKAETVRQIISITKVNPEGHFDKLDEKSLGYLTKLLKVCKHLAK